MNIIQQLETLGQSGSLKQFVSVADMLNHFNTDTQLSETVSKYSKELICMVEPDDDDDDEN